MKQVKDISGALWHAQPLTSYQMLTHIKSRFAGALNIQDCSILTSEIKFKGRRVFFVFLSYPCHTALNEGCLINEHIIDHERLHFSVYLRANLPLRSQVKFFR